MKTRKRAWLLALVTMAAAGGAWSQAPAETFRCPQADGGVVFQQSPCALADLVHPEPSRVAPPVVVAPAEPKPVAVAVPAPAAPKRPAPERSVSLPAPVSVPAPVAAAEDDGFVKPTRRKREILDLSAQFERCRADAPGFAEKSAPVYAAWTRRHAAVLAEYSKLLALKVRAGRRGEATLPLRLCTEEWLQEIEPLSRMPDVRFQTVEKTWQVFLGALMTGDRSTLMSCLGGKAETRWKERALQLSDEDMRRIAGSIRALKVQWGDDYEKEGLVADNDNRVAGVAFRNINEEWKIMDLGAASTVALPVAPVVVPAKVE